MWLPEQDKAVIKAAESVWQEHLDTKGGNNVPTPSPAVSQDAQPLSMNSLAAQKGLLRANREKVQHQASTTNDKHSHDSKGPTAPHGSKPTGLPAQLTASTNGVTTKPHMTAPAQPLAPIAVTSAAASPEAAETADIPTIAPNKRRRLSPALGQASKLPAEDTHPSADAHRGIVASKSPAKLSTSLRAAEDRAVKATDSQLDASVPPSQAADTSPAASLPDNDAQPSPAAKVLGEAASDYRRNKRLSKSPQLDSQMKGPEQSTAKDPKRRRLRKASDVSSATAAPHGGQDVVVKQENDHVSVCLQTLLGQGLLACCIVALPVSAMLSSTHQFMSMCTSLMLPDFLIVMGSETCRIEATKGRRASRRNNPEEQYCSRTASLQPRFCPDSAISRSQALQPPPVPLTRNSVQLPQHHSHPQNVASRHRQHYCLSRRKLCHSLYHSQTWTPLHMLRKPTQQTPTLLFLLLPQRAAGSSLSLPQQMSEPANCPAWLQRLLPRSKLLRSCSTAVLARLHRPRRLVPLLDLACHSRPFNCLPLHTHQARALPCPAA